MLLLPALDGQEVYDRYRFDEPWDGPNNRRLHDLVWLSYSCMSRPQRGSSPCYAAVVGPQTAWRGAGPVRLEEIADGPGQTLHLVEVSAMPVHWMEPRDLAFDRMSFRVNGPKGLIGPSSHHPGIANSLRVDGSVTTLLDRGPPEWVRAQLTVAGDEPGEAF